MSNPAMTKHLSQLRICLAGLGYHAQKSGIDSSVDKR